MRQQLLESTFEHSNEFHFTLQFEDAILQNLVDCFLFDSSFFGIPVRTTGPEPTWSSEIGAQASLRGLQIPAQFNLHHLCFYRAGDYSDENMKTVTRVTGGNVSFIFVPE